MSTETRELEAVAREAGAQFEQAQRPDSDEFYMRTRDGSPEWVTDLCRHAHGNGYGDYLLPDDWRYMKISAALDHLADGGDPDDAHEFADQAVDLYTGSRFEWLASHLSRAGYCDDAAGDLGGDATDIVGLVGLGQYAEASEVYALVVESLRERAEAVEEIAEEFEENALGDEADYLREHGIEATRVWIGERIEEVRAGDDPFDPDGESVGNLEVARDRLS